VNRHRLDPFSLFFGALFAGLGISFMLGSSIGDAKHALWPVLAIIVGCTFLAWGVARVMKERRPVVAPTEAIAQEPADEDGEHPA
jgi:hypothetical protein